MLFEIQIVLIFYSVRRLELFSKIRRYMEKKIFVIIIKRYLLYY
jgi:hypothetical protein